MPDSGSPGPDIQMTSSVVDRLRDLPREQAKAVAQAIRAIGQTRGRSLLPGTDGKQYMIIAPIDDSAPAIIYRESDDGTGFLVTALVERDAYDAYEDVGRQSILDSPIVKAILAALGGAALAALLSSRSGKSSFDL